MRSKYFLVALAVFCLLPAACGTPEERAAAYLEKAQQLFDEEEYTSARIEAMNAAQIEPRNADVRYLLAEIEEQEQNFRQSVGHLQVAIDADPDHLPSRIKLGNYYILGKAVDEADEQVTAAENLAPDDSEVMLLRARVQYLRDDVDGAMAQIEKILAADPKRVDATVFKAGIFVSREDYDAALGLIDGSLDFANTEEVRQLRQFRIIMLRAAGRNIEVEADLKALMKEFPEDESYAVTLAQLYIAEERVAEAEQVLRAIVDANSTDPDRRIDFARFVASQRGVEAAEEVLKEFVAELPESAKLKFALGRFYEATGEQTGAYGIYEEISQAEPTTDIGLAARNRMVAIKVSENELDTAQQMIADILAVDPDNPDSLLARAAFQYNEKAYDDAIANLRTVLRSDSESIRSLLLLARSHVGAGDVELAQDAYRRLIEVSPNHPTATNELADLLARIGEADQAEEVLRRKLEIAPEDRRSASNLVEALLLQGETDAAEVEARSLLKMDDPSGLGEFQLGRVMQAKQSSDEAILAYKQALQKNPEALQALQGLTGALVEAGRTTEAIAFLNDYIAEHPDLTAARLLLGTVYAREKDLAEATAQFEKVIELRPESNRAYASLAALHPDDPAARVKVYERGYTANPNDGTLGFLLANELERGKQYDKAMEIYESLLAADESNILAANNLAALLLDHRSDAASFQRALELAKPFADGDQAALLDTLGWAYYRTGEYTNALRYLEQATAAADQVAQLHYHLGMAYVKTQRVLRAREELEKALELAEVEYPGIEEARAALEELKAGDAAGN